MSQASIVDVLGSHPTASAFGTAWLTHDDHVTASAVAHRALVAAKPPSSETRERLKEIVLKHHASPEKLARVDAIKRIWIKRGFPATAKGLKLFPRNEKTRKGNFAESVFAEYLALAGKGETLVYRLRFNPNVDQSMKGDDVLTFSFKGSTCEIVVGEAKFRSSPSKAVVLQIMKGLETAYRAGVPMSLIFVADRLFEANDPLATKVLESSLQIIQKRATLTYAGLLMTGTSAVDHIDKHCPASIPRSGIVSMNITNAEDTIEQCFSDLEREYGVDAG